jgi:hypothetical protein
MTEPQRKVGGRLLRGTTGVFAASMVLLFLIVLGAQIYFQSTGYPGLGWPAVGGHLVAAALAVFCQRLADRRAGALAVLAGLAVVVITALTLWLFWWA